MWRALLVALVPALPLLAQPPAGVPAPPAPAVLSPDYHSRLASWDLTVNVPVTSRPWTRYLSWLAVPADRLDTFRRLLAWKVHQMTFQQALTLPVEVPGSQGRLYRLDLRDYGWSPYAWQAVAGRDYLFREPWLDPKIGAFLRYETAAAPKPRRGTLPLVAVVWAPTLLRDAFETDRSQTYYDLLYSRQRFGDRVWWKGGGGYGRGWYFRGPRAQQGGFVDANFPRDRKDWEAVFGIDVVKAFARRQRVDLNFGAVVEGGADFPGKGSIVTLRNRLVVVLQGPMGPTLETYDVKETTGRRDYIELAPELPFLVDRGRVVADAGELLAYLPGGGQAEFLIDAKGKRLEVADAHFANDTSDPGMNPGVRVGACGTCHGPEGGYIAPRNAVAEFLKAGVDPKIYGRDQEVRFRGFFLGWEKRAAQARVPYLDLLDRATADQPPPAHAFEAAVRAKDMAALKRLQDRAEKARGTKGWAGAALAKEVGAFRKWYDGPVDAGQAAAEIGLPADGFRRVAGHSPKARPNQLLRGMAVPRRTWEIDVSVEIGLQLAAHRE